MGATILPMGVLRYAVLIPFAGFAIIAIGCSTFYVPERCRERGWRGGKMFITPTLRQWLW